MSLVLIKLKIVLYSWPILLRVAPSQKSSFVPSFVVVVVVFVVDVDDGS